MVKGKRQEISYQKLFVYQKSKDLVLRTYKLTMNYPKTETFSLVPQMRRAAVSVTANVVEGYAKDSSAEFARFLTISIGSLTELEVYFDLSLELGFIKEKDYNIMINLLLEVKRLLYGTRKKVKGKR